MTRLPRRRLYKSCECQLAVAHREALPSKINKPLSLGFFFIYLLVFPLSSRFRNARIKETGKTKAPGRMEEGGGRGLRVTSSLGWHSWLVCRRLFESRFRGVLMLTRRVNARSSGCLKSTTTQHLLHLESRLHFRMTRSDIGGMFTMAPRTPTSIISGKQPMRFSLHRQSRLPLKNRHLGKIKINGLMASSAHCDLTEPLKLGLSHDSSLWQPQITVFKSPFISAVTFFYMRLLPSLARTHL